MTHKSTWKKHERNTAKKLGGERTLRSGSNSKHALGDVVIEFEIRGIPQAQGSTKAFVKNGRPIITSTNKNLRAWRDLCASEAQRHAPTMLMEGAISLDISFHLPKPKNSPKRYIPHIKRPDLDKLIRSIADSLAGILYRDDSQITQVYARKSYEDFDRPPGATISVKELSFSPQR